jgi:hypothetical protein
MTGDLFMNWVDEKLLPTCEQKRKIRSLSSLTKREMADLLNEHIVEHLDLPWNDERWKIWQQHEPDYISDCEGVCRVRLQQRPEFTAEDIGKTAPKSRPFIPNTDELKVAFVTYLKLYKPDVLDCQVENLLREKGHCILWTPPYCPEMQPIEMF